MKTVHTWQQDIPLKDFGERLGIPADDMRHLTIGFVNPVYGVTLKFVRIINDSTSTQWTKTISRRKMMRKLGLPVGWASHLAHVWPRRDAVKLRFVR